MVHLGFKQAVPWIATAALAFALSVTAAEAKQNVSPNYDGTYAGQAKVMPELSKKSCTALQRVSADVKKGHMHGRDAKGDKFSAIVTSDGFFTGRYRFRQAGKSSTFEGNAHAGTLDGGLISLDGDCVWLVQLSKT